MRDLVASWFLTSGKHTIGLLSINRPYGLGASLGACSNTRPSSITFAVPLARCAHHSQGPIRWRLRNRRHHRRGLVTTVIRTRRAPSPQIGARDTALDGAANGSAGVHSAPNMDAGVVNAAAWRAEPSSDRLLTKPTTGIAGCCARAASGHTAAAPPSATSNSRRPMVTVI